MPTAFHQAHSGRHRPIAHLGEHSVADAAERIASKVCRNARAHSADTVVFCAPDLSLTAIVETSAVCVQAERQRPHQVVGRWRRVDPVVMRQAIEAYLHRTGIAL